MTQRRTRSKYLHIGWSIPALVILIGGIVLKASLSNKEALCTSTVGRIGRALTRNTTCDQIDVWSTVGTAALWIGGVLLVFTLAGSYLRKTEGTS